MILIADSGSSKTDWRVIQNNGTVTQFRTIGFNPYYQTKKDMIAGLNSPPLLELKEQVNEVHFYGAGCTSPGNQESVRQAINSLYPAARVFVDHDLLASARATCGHEPGIACILGTGSNSGDYDGENITQSRPSPGYLLGDEGGGSYIGKHLLQDFIYDDMPASIREELIRAYNLSIFEIQDNVYKKPFPNRYMAGFCTFITQHKSDPYCYKLIYDGFKDFFYRHVMRYDAYRQKPVNFVGSIAYYNHDVLRKIGEDLQVQIKTIIETPIAGLTLYHQKKNMSTTESPSFYDHLENMSVNELLTNMNKEDQSVPLAVRKALPQLEALIEAIVPRMQKGGRLIYIGAGTSGRLGILDASECPPTYGVPHDLVIGLIAGGDQAIRKAVENAEDDPTQAWKDIRKQGVNEFDTIIGIAASGTTPYVIGGVKEAKAAGLLTGCITCNAGTPLAKSVSLPVEVVVGPEFVTGSTRMKSGTGQKLALNMISTSVMIKLGKVKGNKMVDMQLSNQKLVQRGTRMIMESTGLTENEANAMLHQYGSVRNAVAAYENRKKEDSGS